MIVPGPSRRQLEALATCPWVLDVIADLGRPAKSGSITPQFLERVAHIYRMNQSYGPTAAIRREFKVSPRMASTYVARARQAGLLPPYTPKRQPLSA